MWQSLLTFILYGPFFLASFILSIVAMSQKRVIEGAGLLLLTLIAPPVLGLWLFGNRLSEFGNDLKTSSSSANSSGAAEAGPYQSGDAPETIADAVSKALADANRESTLRSELAEMVRLRKSKAAFEQKLANLKSFSILSGSFYKEKDVMGDQNPFIDLKIQNNCGYSVKKAHFRGILQSPGREIPWLDGTFNYEISGGVEPGETVTWHLALDPYGDWGKVKIQPDAHLELTVTDLDGTDGESLFGDALFDASDEKKLQELEKKHGGSPAH